MKLIKALPILGLLTLLYKPLSYALKRYKFGVYYFDTQDESYLEDKISDESMDLRGTPTHECVCGSDLWNIRASFDNYEIATYFLEMECVLCGSLATAPTPLDRESME
jgi:hypothetical protein